MTTQVLVFGAAGAAVNADRVVVRVEEPATVRGVLEALRDQHPGLAFAVAAARLAVNQAFAGPDTPVTAADEIALISLVGGG